MGDRVGRERVATAAELDELVRREVELADERRLVVRDMLGEQRVHDADRDVERDQAVRRVFEPEVLLRAAAVVAHGRLLHDPEDVDVRGDLGRRGDERVRQAVLAQPSADELVLLDEGDSIAQVRQADRGEDGVQAMPLEHRERVVPVVARAVVEGEDEPVGDRRSVAGRRQQRVRLERLVVAEQVLDLPLEIGDRAGIDAAEGALVRVADVVVHDEDRAHVRRRLAPGREGALFDRQPFELALDRLAGRENDVLEALRRGDRRRICRDPREPAAETRLGQPRRNLGAEAGFAGRLLDRDDALRGERRREDPVQIERRELR